LILCRALRRQCRLADARAAAEEACRRSPEMPAAYAELAESFLLENQPAEAERSIRRALELKACEPEYHCILGKALSSQDRLDDAIAAMEEALRLNAASPRVRQELERLRQIHDSR
jgi:Flp pilus assembly protein TadD